MSARMIFVQKLCIRSIQSVIYVGIRGRLSCISSTFCMPKFTSYRCFPGWVVYSDPYWGQSLTLIGV